MSFTNYLAGATLNYIFSKTSGIDTQPTIWLGLHYGNTDPTEAGVAQEPSGNGYARLETAASDWNASTGLTDPASVTNASDLEMATATDDWGSGADMTFALLFDAETGGNLLAFGSLTTNKPVLDGDTPRFTAGDIQITLD